MTKKFKCEVIRTDKFSVELDEKFFNEEWFENFNRHFYDYEDLEELSKYIAQVITRRGIETFIDGIGVVMQNGEIPMYVVKEKVNTSVNIVFELGDQVGDQECDVYTSEEVSQ
ncbi:hypothetical protein [Listeria booriae]|uniref:hypothetical protein n=1 Tax=Listeria booriae TaxID=1552123 RepID=UPI00162583B7|nr:hypothetical protein [Listeria booriae]